MVGVEENDDQLDDQFLDEDESVNDSAHKSLLGAVSQLYEKKRVKAPTRNEPSFEVSEFHLSQPDKKRGGRVTVTGLAKALNKRTSHLEIGQKLQTVQKRAKTLPKPLEKFHADKINREAGYEQTKQQLNRWDAIVHQQRVAETVTFPLPSSDSVKVIYNTTDIKQMFRKPTELELKLAEVLNQPDPLAQIREEKKQEEEEFPLSLEEIIEKRKLMAKFRARQSYKDAKAAWKKKIKSKTFRKIERKARSKEQLKEFEEMQKKDPEAALKKLEELERSRAEERMTQRHGSTGRWAKGKAIRAKYDKEARIALSEQLSKKRELTMKLAQNRDDSGEEEVVEAEAETVEEQKEDPNNPWVLKPTKEMQEFVSGYRKYWETLGKLEESKQKEDTVVKVREKKVTEEESQSVNDAVNNTDSKNSHELSGSVKSGSNSNVNCPNSAKKATDGVKAAVNSKSHTVNLTSLNSSGTPPNTPMKASGGIPKPVDEQISKPRLVKYNVNTLKTPKRIQESEESSISHVSTNKNDFVVNESSVKIGKENIALDKRLCKFTVTNSKSKSSKNTIASKSSKVINDAGLWTVGKMIQKKNKKDSKLLSKFTTNDELGNTYKVSELKKSPDSLIVSGETLNTSGSFTVSEVVVNSKDSHSKSTENAKREDLNMKNTKNKSVHKSTKQRNEVQDKTAHSVNNTSRPGKKTTKSLDDMFNEAEDKLNKTIQRKIEKINKSLNRKRKESGSESESNADEIPSLEMKRPKTTADIDEPLLERSGDNREGERTTIKKTLELAASTSAEELKPSEDIDPNKFLKVKPRHLSSELPQIMSEGEDALDDEEKAAEERHLTISEAFADDNVVDEFQREKEEEEKKSKVEDVDLTLPGWGSWAGHNISSTSKAARRKRKKFAIKVPLAPRRDKNRDNIIINEDADQPLKEHQVSTVPYPFTSVKDFEASVRAPIGSTWVPQRAFRRLTRPAVTTQAGAIIAPMDEDHLVNPSSVLPHVNKRNFA